MICKFCLEEMTCIKCHIIPRSFWKPILEPHASIISSNPKDYQKKSRAGIYDENMICEDCEKLFSPFDYYSYRFLSTDIPSDNVIIHNGERIAYLIEKYDYNKLKLFFVSLLWRASASSNKFFDLINIGPFEDRFKEMILKQNPGSEDEISIALRRFEKKSYSTSMLNPSKTRFDGINFIRFYLSDFTAYIKLDKRKSPEFVRDVMLKANRPLCILLTDIRKTKEFPIMKKLAERQRHKFEKVK